jgi:hypothetical protein
MFGRPCIAGVLVGLSMLLAGCTAGFGAASDTPVLPTEARDTVRLRIELPAVHSCEQAFDLALYRDRGVDLVEWDRHHRSCSGRVVLVRYLPARVDRATLVAAAQRLAIRVEILPGGGLP